MKFLSPVLVMLVILIGITSIWIGIVENDRMVVERWELRKKCVDVHLTLDNRSIIDRKVAFDSEFFCPQSTFTPLEALTRAEIILKSRQENIQLILKETTEGIEIDSMFGKTNGQEGVWVLYANGERITRALDKIQLNKGHYLHWYYE